MWTRLVFMLAALLAAPAAPGQYACPQSCQLPTCHCASTEAPGGLAPEHTPQFLLVTFDDCVRPATEALLAPVLDGLANPNGRSLPRTYFVSRTNCPNPEGNPTHAATVRALYDAGHEIANHTQNHDTSEQHTLEQWITAISAQQRYLYDEVGLPPGAVRGFRAPFLRTNEAMYTAVQAAGFRYESSLLEQPFHGAAPVTTAPEAYVWPHTLDYGAGVSCGFFLANDCPTAPKPGLWTVPAWEFLDPAGLEADSAVYYGAFDIGTPYGGVYPIAGDRLLRLMVANFRDRYEGNRAPFNLFFHAAAFADPERQADVRRVLEATLAQPDVWAITMEGLIAWMRAPVPASEMPAWFEAYCETRGCPQPVAAEAAAPARFEASLYPNPTAGDATLAVVHDAPGPVTLEVVDVLGRTVHRTAATTSAGARRYTVPLRELAAGTYVVRLRQGVTVRATRLVVKR